MKNVMLLCMSPLRWMSNESTYSYLLRDETIGYVHGHMTNEAPVKSLIEKLKKDHNQRLDRIIMICSEKISGETIGKNEPPKDEAQKQRFQTLRDEILFDGKCIFDITHKDYFEWIIKNYAAAADDCYKEKEIDFEVTHITDFANETDVIKAVTESAGQVMKGYKDVNLYIDFNGGPRNVAVLIMGLSNLMKLRNVTVKEITYMDFENKEKETNVIPVKNMNELFRVVDLVSGVNEYVSYGRIRILKDYFKSCGDQRIHIILRVLENFSNNMQLCLTDYVMANKEQVKNALKSYQANSKASSSYEIMFSFVAEDILRGCSKLLDGSLPEMILWCVEKEFTQQALLFYIELIPAYLWDNKIFCPSAAEEQEYICWRIDQEYSPDEIPNTYRNFSRHMDDKYYWMHYYLLKDYSQTIDADWKTEYMLSLLNPAINRANTSIDTDDLCDILKDYYLIYNQRISSRYSTIQLGNTGELWDYQEMRQKLQAAALRISGITPHNA